MFGKNKKKDPSLNFENYGMLDTMEDADEEYLELYATIKTRDKVLSKKELRALEKKEKAENIIKVKEAKDRAAAEKRDRKKHPKKEKSETYVIKKNTTMKFLRLIFWGILIFMFVKGVIVSLRPDPTIEVNKIIADFKTEFSSYKEQDNEILSFAQNFAKEFLTYSSREESEYAERLRLFASPNVTNATYKFNDSAKVLYSQAYKKETYSVTQSDVYVLVEVEYTFSETDPDNKNKEEKVIIDNAILKVPINMRDNRYIVEDMPAFVNDDIKIGNYAAVEFLGKEKSKEESDAIKQAVSNFFRAYYEEEQSVINYYLTRDADKTSFKGLNKRVLFDKIENIRSYTIEGSNDIIVLVTVNIFDKNAVITQQRFNLKVVLTDNRYYIKEMNTRNVNLNL